MNKYEVHGHEHFSLLNWMLSCTRSLWYDQALNDRYPPTQLHPLRPYFAFPWIMSTQFFSPFVLWWTNKTTTTMNSGQLREKRFVFRKHLESVYLTNWIMNQQTSPRIHSTYCPLGQKLIKLLDPMMEFSVSSLDEVTAKNGQ